MSRRVAIVTGALSRQGIGFATCRKLAETETTVILTDLIRDDGAANELQARADEILALGGSAVAIHMDVTKKRQIVACVDQVINAYQRIDIVFNNAGTPVGVGSFLELTDKQWDLSYAVNLKGMADLSQAVLPHMIDQGGGVIINNASTSGLGATARMAPYVATKFAVVGLTKALAAEFGPSQVRVNAVCPGMVWTDMGQIEVEHARRNGEDFEEAKRRLADPDLVPVGRWADAEEIADAVVYLCSDRARYITGVALPVAGGMAPGL